MDSMFMLDAFRYLTSAILHSYFLPANTERCSHHVSINLWKELDKKP